MPQAHGLPLSQPLTGAWLSLLSSGDQPWWAWSWGGGREMPSPSPREATEECLHAKQNVTPFPTSSQSLHGLCPPCTSPPPPRHPGSRCHD